MRDRFVTQTIGWYVVAFVGFAVAVWSIERRPASGAITIRWIWCFGIALRLLMVATTPTLSDDVYRYLWEGHLVAEGVSPYDFSIDDPAGDPYTIEARTLANNQTLSSPYLPTAPVVFGVLVAIFPAEPITMQLAMIAFDLAAAFILSRLLALAALPARRIALYLLHPFAIIEIGHSAHLDALMMMLAAAGLWLTLRPRNARSGPRGADLGHLAGAALLALATLTRPIPALLVAVVFWRWSWPQRLAYGAVAAGLTLGFGLESGFGLGAESTGTGVFGSARAYTETFRFNSAIYQSLETWVGGRGLDDRGWNEPVALTRLIIVVAVAIIMALVWWRSRRVANDARSLLRMATVPLAMYALLTPVLHPWYLLILLLLVPLLAPADDEPRATGGRLRWVLLAPWLYLSGSVFLSYLTYRDPAAFAEIGWVRRVEWVPTLTLLTGALLWLRVVKMRSSAPAKPKGART